MTTAQRTLTINAAFLQEIKDDNRELKQLLDDCAERLAHASTGHVDPKRLVGSLARLRDQVALHFALEEAYGYFDDAIDVAPRSAARPKRSAHSMRGCTFRSALSWNGPSSCSITKPTRAPTATSPAPSPIFTSSFASTKRRKTRSSCKR